MADKNVQLQDMQGNNLFVKTKASIVFNDNNEALGTVEAGAQVNKIEKISLNGVALQIAEKGVNIELPAAAEYTVAKDESTTAGYAASYHLQKDGVNVGEAINIPKDMVVQSGDVKTCEEDDKPVTGYKVGDKYIDLLLANTDDQHIYILVSDLVDVYKAGEGIKIEGNTVAIDTAVTATVEALNTAKTELQASIDAVSDAKADKATTLAGYGITDGITFVELV